jgi:CheY-like chemotaxis protein
VVPPTDKSPLKASGTLLVVDDEAFVLEALTAIVQSLGYQVIAAENGHQAISKFKENQQQISGVLLDMIMPDMRGDQVMKALRDIRPDIKVILSSGYSLEGLGEEGGNPGGDGFIQKPYQVKRLAEVLNKVLHPRPV